jgi:UDP-4-amino-4,6-dideoxy-N-acetyl-beta-L-altrosamine N-acetyltransferase
MIEGKVISLRPLERRHLERTLEWANEPKLMFLLNRAQQITAEEHEEWFTSIREKSDRFYFSIELNNGGAHIGNIWLWDIDPRHRRAELRIVIGSDAHTGQGAGSEAISLLCDYAFAQLNLHKIYAYVLVINPRARRAFEKAGFILEGTLRQDRWTGDSYTDVYVLGKLR